MKNLKSIVAIAFIAVAFGSCADEKKTEAEKAVNNYVAYIDSVGNVASEDLAEKWDDVESDYIAKKIEAESALENLEDRMELDQKLEAGSKKYDEFKANLLAEKQKMEAANYKAKVRSALFVGQQIGDDMNFAWVNKDNILQTYETFVNTTSDNKDNYTREEWDEIKLLYEALDTRKNTVEKEGLSTSDNLKIAGLKTRFATFFKVNRISAKSEENAEAKE
jgi:hypothetical protein